MHVWLAVSPVRSTEANVWQSKRLCHNYIPARTSKFHADLHRRLPSLTSTSSVLDLLCLVRAPFGHLYI